MAGQVEAEVRGTLNSIREKHGKTGPPVVETLCVLVLRLAREVDELRAELEEKP